MRNIIQTAVIPLSCIALTVAIGCRRNASEQSGIVIAGSSQSVPLVYLWLPAGSTEETLMDAILTPDEFSRVNTAAGTYQDWLRHLPVKPEGAAVVSYSGKIILAGDDRHLARVVDIDVGKRDLQQCADFTIRLDAEYRWSHGNRDEIWYCFTSGDTCRWSDWRRGIRPIVAGSWVTWVRSAKADASYANFRRYLDKVFHYAGTLTLARDTKSIPRSDAQGGDFFVDPGSPGHAVIIIDVCEDEDGERLYLLGQGFMPAMSFYILRQSNGLVWFKGDEYGIKTPFWDKFRWSQLHRFL